MSYLMHLPPWTRFRLKGMPEITGVLVRSNECRAVVKLDRPVQDVEFIDANGETRQFRCRGSQTTSWASMTVVEALSVSVDPPEENREMSKSKTASKKAAKENKPASEKTRKPRAPRADGKLSCIDAAAKVLAEAGEALSTKTMIERMAAKGYWSSPGGQTPAATLYSAILREIQKKGGESRFVKSDKGLFARSGGTPAPKVKPAKEAKPAKKAAKVAEEAAATE